MQFVLDQLKQNKIKGCEFDKNEQTVNFTLSGKNVLIYKEEDKYNIHYGSEKFLELEKDKFKSKLKEIKTKDKENNKNIDL